MGQLARLPALARVSRIDVEARSALAGWSEPFK